MSFALWLLPQRHAWPPPCASRERKGPANPLATVLEPVSEPGDGEWAAIFGDQVGEVAAARCADDLGQRRKHLELDLLPVPVAALGVVACWIWTDLATHEQKRCRSWMTHTQLLQRDDGDRAVAVALTKILFRARKRNCWDRLRSLGLDHPHSAKSCLA